LRVIKGCEELLAVVVEVFDGAEQDESQAAAVTHGLRKVAGQLTLSVVDGAVNEVDDVERVVDDG